MQCGACYRRKPWKKRFKQSCAILSSEEQKYSGITTTAKRTQWNDDDDDNFIWFGWLCCAYIYFDFCVQTFTNSSLSYLNQHIPFSHRSERSPTTSAKSFCANRAEECINKKYSKLLIFPWHCRKFLLVLQSHRLYNRVQRQRQQQRILWVDEEYLRNKCAIQPSAANDTLLQRRNRKEKKTSNWT